MGIAILGCVSLWFLGYQKLAFTMLTIVAVTMWRLDKEDCYVGNAVHSTSPVGNREDGV